MESTLTGLYPWGRCEASERLSAWGIAGYGAGKLAVTPEGLAPMETDMDLMMAALGGRETILGGRLLEARGAGVVFGLDVERRRREDLEPRIEALRLLPANDDPENRIGVELPARW